MNLAILLHIKTPCNILNQQVRFFVRDPFPNKLFHYLRRAELIDSIRLSLRSNNPDSLRNVIRTRLLDIFVVTQALRSAPNADVALSFVDLLKNIDNAAHLLQHKSTLHALATVLAKSRRGLELKALIDEIHEGKHGNVRFSFMNLMQWYATIGDLEAVLDVWKQYQSSRDKHVCTESYNIIMSLYAQKGMDTETVEVFYKMIHEGTIPNSRTYTVMIEHLVNSGKLEPAIEIFRILPLMRIKRTSKQYLVLVEGLVGMKRFDEVKTLLQEMQGDGKFPGRAMCTALLCLHQAGHVEETEDFLKEMFQYERIKSISSYGDASDDEDEETGVNVKLGDADANMEEVRLKPWLDPKALAMALNEWGPDVVSLLEDVNFVWTARLVCKVLRNFKSSDTAWYFFCWVAYQPGFTHDIYTVQRMMAILAKHGKVGLVNQLITKIRSEEMKLPFSTIRLIIDFYGISKNADAALKVFREDRTICGPITKYNLMLLYSSLLRTLTKCKRDSDAIDVLEEMIGCQICPDTQTFSGLMYHFASQGDIKTVQKLFTIFRQNGVEPDGYMYKVLIQAYCKCERAALAWRVFEDMKNSNLMPDTATKDLLVKSLWKEGKRKEAAIVEESCDGIKSDLPLKQHGHKWTVSSEDLARVCNIYSNNFKLSTG